MAKPTASGLEVPILASGPTPATGRMTLYPKSGGWYTKDSTGAESLLGGGGGAPSGTAGGSLAGSYPNPTLAAGAVNSTEINAAIKDAAAATASLRTLGTGALQAAAGNHAHTLIDLPDAWPKKSVRAASTANVALPPGGTSLVMDGVTLVNGDRVLLWQQTTSAQNGIYTVGGVGTAVTLTRTTDADTSAKIAGAVVAVDDGTTQSGRRYATYFKSTSTLDTTAMTWNVVLDGAWVGVASGVASLDGTTKVPVAQVPTGTTGTTVALGNHTHVKANITDLGTIGTAAALNVPATGDAATGEVVKGSDTRLTNSRAPSGTAGGGLGDSYPNPTVRKAFVPDTRAVDDLPQSGSQQVSWAFKTSSTVGISDGSTYCLVQYMRSYTDTTAGLPQQVAYTDLGNTYRRQATAIATNTWNAWVKVGDATNATVFTNDARLVDARTPTAHTHLIADLPTDATVPAALGTAAAGTSASVARRDHVHPMPTAAQVGASATGHTHAISDVSTLQAELDTRPELIEYTTTVPTRPTTSGKVIWQGQVDPAANALAGDSWWPTA